MLVKRTSVDWRALFCGVIIGALGIAPAVSGGALAALLGYYEPLLFAAAHPVKALKTNAKTLLPLGLGIVGGILVFGRVLWWLFEAFPSEMRCAVAGALVGALPAFVKDTVRNTFVSIKHVTAAIVTCICGIWLFYGGSFPNVGNPPTFSEWMLCGGIYAIGTVVVGISSSCILLSMGAYESVLLAISGGVPAALLPLALGFLLTAAVVVCIVNFLYTNHKTLTQFAVFGFLVSSILPVIPPLKPDKSGVLSLMLGLLCAAGSIWINESFSGKGNNFTAKSYSARGFSVDSREKG